jgi:hypothetical protein
MNNAQEMTFLGLGQLCDPIAKHFMHLPRPWCPTCYLEARAQGIPAWDPLYTYVRTTKICIWHMTPLMLACANCGRGQRHVPKFPFLDHCEHCGADLAEQQPGDQPDRKSLEELMWHAQAAADVIEQLTNGAGLSPDHFRQNLQALIDQHFSGVQDAFYRRLGCVTVRLWLRRYFTPTWASLLDVAYRLNIPPAQLASPQAPLTDPLYWRQLPKIYLDKPHHRPAKALLDRARSELLKDPLVTPIKDYFAIETVTAVARRLDMNAVMLRRHFPEEVKAYGAKRLRLRSVLKTSDLQDRVNRIRVAAAVLMEQGLPVTERNLKRTGLVKVSDMVQQHKL